jgi:hypothetical protein
MRDLIKGFCKRITKCTNNVSKLKWKKELNSAEEIVLKKYKKELNVLKEQYRKFLLENKIITKESTYPYTEEILYIDREQKPVKKVKRLNLNADGLDITEEELKHLRRSYLTICKRHILKYTGDHITFTQFCDQYIKQNKRCYYSNMDFVIEKRISGAKALHPLTMTIDKVDPYIGYTKDNTVFCCWFVNCAKNAFDLNTIIPLWKTLVKNLE